jgi:hypothetical protein
MLTATEFRARLDRLGLPRQEAADRLGLSLNGLFHQMRDRPVSRQTELLLAHLEREQARHKRRPRSRQRPVAAALALALVIAVPTFAGERDVSEATPAFDWDRCHDRQDACREADRIAAACTQGHCDELALRQANEAGVLGLHGRAPMNDTAKIRRFEIRAQWDTEASVWWCSND